MFKYFSLAEFECKCGCGVNKADFDLIDILDKIRHDLHKPLIINSGYRCPQHNRDAGGAKSSFHLSGLAIDVSTKNLDANELWELVSRLLDEGLSIGVSKTFVHLDGRSGPKKMWAY